MIESGLEVTSLIYDIDFGTFVASRVRGNEGIFVSNNVPEVPQLGPIVILLHNVVGDLIV